MRVLRWFKLIPWDIKEGDIKKKPTKEKLKKWIKHVIPVRRDRVLWGQQLTGDRRRQVNREDRELQDHGEGGAGQPGSQAQEEHTARVRTAGGAQEQDGEAELGGLPGSQNNLQIQTARESTPRHLPCSRTDVLKTSPQKSRKTRSKRIQCSGAASRSTQQQQSISGNWTLFRTRSSLGWRKGVG